MTTGFDATALAADPALRAACEACEDWGNYKEIVK